MNTAAQPSDLHPLIARQLRKLGLAADGPAPAEDFMRLLRHVSRAYADFDQERYLLDRSQNIASAEMAVLNDALRESQAQMHSLLSLSSDWVWEQDSLGCFTFVSDELEARTGLGRSALIGRTCSVDGSLRASADDIARMQACVAAGERFHDVVFEVMSPRGVCHHMRIIGEPVRVGGEVVAYRGVGSDVTEAVLAGQKIRDLACFDSLTGLPNRRMFLEELGRTLARCARQERRFAVLFIDLDRFKTVNDNLGHAAGDLLLSTVSHRLSSLLREADLLARLGGDEFVVVSDGSCEAAALSKFASRVLGAIAEPVNLDGRCLQVSGSVGIAVYPEDGSDAATLLRSADAAMYQAKDKGRNTFEFFTAELAQRAALHFELEGDLRLAVERGQFELVYQPKVDAASGQLCGMEALLRWNHPERGLLSPIFFIELAEESGLIVPIGRWVVRAACLQMAQWLAEGHAPPRCAVNISVRQIVSGTLVDDVRSALAEAKLDASLLEVEITESMLMSDAHHAASQIGELDALGVHIAIDDFGTGHSSLAYLKRFPVSTLKIDRSFVRDLPGDVDDLAIIRAVIAMGHSLGIEIVAEGVETMEQRSCLADLGCDVLQGYLFSKPMPPSAMRAWLGRSGSVSPPDPRRGAVEMSALG